MEQSNIIDNIIVQLAIYSEINSIFLVCNLQSFQ